MCLGEEDRGMRQDSNLWREEDEEGKGIVQILKKTLGCCRMAKDEEARTISMHDSSGHSNGPLVSLETLIVVMATVALGSLLFYFIV